MRAFLLRRALHAVFVLWGVVTAVFFLVRLTGDPTPFLVDQSATQQEIAARDLDPREATGDADGARAPVAGDGRAGRRRAPALDGARDSARRRLGYPQERRRRSREPPRVALPPVDAELLARSHADLAFRRRAGRSPARLRIRRRTPPDPAGDHPGRRPARPE